MAMYTGVQLKAMYPCLWLRKPVYSYVFLCMDMHTNAGLYIPVYGYVYLCMAMYIWPYTGVRSSTKGYKRLRLSVYGNV